MAAVLSADQISQDEFCVVGFHTLTLLLIFCTSESFLRNRSSLDHEATAMMKAQFMSLWDGLDTSSTTQVTQPLPSHLAARRDIWVMLQVLILGECVSFYCR